MEKKGKYNYYMLSCQKSALLCRNLPYLPLVLPGGMHVHWMDTLMYCSTTTYLVPFSP